MPRPWVAAASLIAAAVSTLSLAGPIQLVREIDTTVAFARTTGTGNPVMLGGKSIGTFCTAGATPSLPQACNPWISDGTAAGTHVLHHMNGSPSALPRAGERSVIP